MDFFDDLGEKIVSTGKYAGEKAKEAADLAKLNTQLAQKQYRLDKAYAELGKFYYEHLDEEGVSAESHIAEVNELKSAVDSLKEQIKEIKNK